MTVEVPPERIDPEVEKRLMSMSRRVKVAGFRPGKVPLRIVKQRFGDQVLQEVTDEVLRSSFREAVEQEALRPAGGPRIEPSESGVGRGLKYTATFEVYPDFKLASIEDLEIKRPRVTITDGDVDRTIERLREQRKSHTEVDRPAQAGDEVTIDFTGLIDGAPFAGGQGEDVPVELGSGRMLSEFEDQLLGVRSGETKQVRVNFPSDYLEASLADKTVDFEVKVKRVAAPVLPALDDDLARSFGISEGGVERLRETLRADMQREVEQRIAARVKQQVMEGLVQRNEVDLPQTLVDHEIAHVRERAVRDLGRTDGDKLPDDLFVEQARRRVKLGLLLGEIIRRNDLKPDRERMERALQALASRSQDPQQVINYYRRSKPAMANIEAMVIEDQVVDWVLARSKTTEEETSFADLANTAEPLS
jgi:trigger factor